MTVEVTKDEFERFVSVRDSGAVNTVSPQVQMLAGISKEVHMAILTNYEELSSKYSS